MSATNSKTTLISKLYFKQFTIAMLFSKPNMTMMPYKHVYQAMFLQFMYNQRKGIKTKTCIQPWRKMARKFQKEFISIFKQALQVVAIVNYLFQVIYALLELTTLIFIINVNYLFQNNYKLNDFHSKSLQ